MDAFIVRKRPLESDTPAQVPNGDVEYRERQGSEDEESTDFKLAILASLHPNKDQPELLEALLNADGSIDLASNHIKGHAIPPSPHKKIRHSVVGYQSSLSSFKIGPSTRGALDKRALTKKGKTLYLYSPEDIENHTPCSIIHNFLPREEANALLEELLPETQTFTRERFQLFNRTVESPHTYSFYVNGWDEVERQKTEYIYDGQRVADVRPTLPVMQAVSLRVQDAVNAEIKRRVRDFNPDGRKLKYQSPPENVWAPNAAFVNCYDGGKESVGYHSDQLTYLGPRAVIGSLSLGVAREFRVRKVAAREDEDETSIGVSAADKSKQNEARADSEGQVSVHLPHNSLLIMHAEMQEEWKHSIAPAQAIDPHPIAGNKRINITYRFYRDYLHPRFTPKCKCKVPTVLRCVQRKKGTKGRYMWMCHAHKTPGKEGCNYFSWAEFDDDGFPPWAKNGQISPAEGLK